MNFSASFAEPIIGTFCERQDVLIVIKKFWLRVHPEARTLCVQVPRPQGSGYSPQLPYRRGASSGFSGAAGADVAGGASVRAGVLLNLPPSSTVSGAVDLPRLPRAGASAAGAELPVRPRLLAAGGVTLVCSAAGALSTGLFSARGGPPRAGGGSTRAGGVLGGVTAGGAPGVLGCASSANTRFSPAFNVIVCPFQSTRMLPANTATARIIAECIFIVVVSL